MKTTILLTLCLLAIGCKDNFRREDEGVLKRARMRYFAQKLEFMKDKDTGLCFAVVFYGSTLGLAEVPCAKVQDFLVKENHHAENP